MISKFTQKLLNAGFNVVKPEILEALPHDIKAFTQGLAFSQGMLYESTGTEDASSLRRLDPETGKIESLKTLSGHWGEGIAIQEGRIVQLTWHSGIAIVYDLADFSKLNEWSFAGEGWGLAAMDDGYVMTNGGGELIFRNQNFDLIKTVMARRKGLPLRWLNDLEYARERLLVHRLGDSFLYEIEPENGTIARLIDGSELIRLAKPKGDENVFNGIAYDKSTDTFFLTGKRWPLLFKVRISP
ncbi:MAG TPA: glutaminyl-peptide cyclotransferase [Nitrosomonas sp.]|nr:glutaminyl-peptide cyclotransferase [Nitrosomonas sp.]HNP25648.1 glutaminyl-peptide cyclotransferase [Nitrosomonas sp.]